MATVENWSYCLELSSLEFRFSRGQGWPSLWVQSRSLKRFWTYARPAMCGTLILQSLNLFYRIQFAFSYCYSTRPSLLPTASLLPWPAKNQSLPTRNVTLAVKWMATVVAVQQRSRASLGTTPNNSCKVFYRYTFLEPGRNLSTPKKYRAILCTKTQ